MSDCMGQNNYEVKLPQLVKLICLFVNATNKTYAVGCKPERLGTSGLVDQ